MPDKIKILVIGDIIGNSGRQVIKELLPRLITQYEIDLCIANGENVAGGFGITEKLICDLLERGIDILTSGNHIWDKKELIPIINTIPSLLIPANYPPSVPGYRFAIKEYNGTCIGVINLCGRVFMNNFDCPFRIADDIIAQLKPKCRIIIIDFHAEATSEKVALGWYLDGRVSAVIGTHTHIQTADARILPHGTAYLTDVGMTGAFDSVIGIEKNVALKRFLTQMPQKFPMAKHDLRLNGALIHVSGVTGCAEKIIPLQIPL
ncbi:MAG: TIGR00282 family metallophosphoesterase [bacterium]